MKLNDYENNMNKIREWAMTFNHYYSQHKYHAKLSNTLIKDTFVVWPHGQKSVSVITATWITPKHQVHCLGKKDKVALLKLTTLSTTN